MASPRWPAVLHEGESQRQVEVSADTQTLILHMGGKLMRWPFRELRYRSGGLPRFEHGESLLVVPDRDMVKSIELLNPAAVSAMEKAAGGLYTANDFLSALLAVLIVAGGVSVIAAVVWFATR